MVNNHVFPNASTTVLDGVFASFAAADVRYTSKCQNAWDFERLPTGSAAIIQHPSSLFVQLLAYIPAQVRLRRLRTALRYKLPTSKNVTW